ncbi:MAG: hypothetical protein JXR58_09785 [Bacteroidales bacterium]|nr:hypothetical protein [Bacteroidales bacterium]
MKTTLTLLLLTIIVFSACNKKEEKKDPVMVKLYFFDEKIKDIKVDTNLIKKLEPVEVKSVD